MSVIRSMFHLYRFRSSGGVLWVWCWGVPGVPDTPDHRRTDSRMFRKGADRGCSLPTCPVCYACPHQTWMQWQNTTGGLHLFYPPVVGHAVEMIRCSQLLCPYVVISITAVHLWEYNFFNSWSLLTGTDKQSCLETWLKTVRMFVIPFFFFSTSDKEIARHL